MHPKDALKRKLVDSVGTFEEFVDLNYPNAQLQQFTYQIEGTRIGSRPPAPREIAAITNFLQVLEMPKVALMSSSDPLLDAMGEIITVLQDRLQGGPEALDSL